VTALRAWLKRNRTGLILLGLAMLLGYALWLDAQRTPATQEQLTDLARLDDLRAQFNQDVGRPRLILLLAPT
jgi:hypothetical protein